MPGPSIAKAFSDIKNREQPKPQQAMAEMKPQLEQFIPNQTDWDYQTATTGMRGEALPKGAVSFDPRGRPYFGSGIVGTAKRYWYEFTKDVDKPTADA